MNIVLRPLIFNASLEISDQDQTNANLFYFGFVSPDGLWLILRQDNSVTNVKTYRYATKSNNGSYTTYASAWAAITSLTYDVYNTVKI